MAGNKRFNPNIVLTIGAMVDLNFWLIMIPKLRKKIHAVKLKDGTQRCFVFNKNILWNDKLIQALNNNENRLLFRVIETD